MKKTALAFVLFLTGHFLFAQQNVLLIIADDMGTSSPLSFDNQFITQ